MAKRLIQLAKELKLRMSDLVDILDSLGYNNMSYSPSDIVPNHIAEMIAGICSDGDLLSLIKPSTTTVNPLIQDDKYHLKILGKIDIDTPSHKYTNDYRPKTDCYYNQWDVPNYNNEVCDFRIEELIVLISDNICSIKISDINEYKPEHPLYSVLIGPNGAGKSSILRDIVNFFIELNAQITNNEKASSYKGLLRGLRYHINGQVCFVVKTDRSFVATINGKICKLEHIKIPSIVACHFGAFDKFPNQTVDGSIKTKYDVPFYKYVGAHINGSMISSSAIAFRLLFALTEQMSINLQKSICSILDFIKYDHAISLQYSLVPRSRKRGYIQELIVQGIEKDREYLKYSIKEKQELASQLYSFYKNKVTLAKYQCIYKINFDNEYTSDSEKSVLKYIYKLKQYGLLNSVHVLFYKQGKIISSDEMSSGEFAMLATILSIAAAANNHHTLVLIDEPELSQHPNWQMSLIENLDKALANHACQLLIATHSHMLISDLPQGRSNVIQLDKMRDGSLLAKMIGCSTYGWSAEEVLLKVFKTATDRNRYFGERIAKLLEKMGNNSIIPEEVTMELQELMEISKHLSDIDPMKSVLNTIINTYSR